jgi:hypothetical protein
MAEETDDDLHEHLEVPSTYTATATELKKA